MLKSLGLRLTEQEAEQAEALGDKLTGLRASCLRNSLRTAEQLEKALLDKGASA